MKIAHLTTVDNALRYLLLPQLRAAMDEGAEVTGISARGKFVGDLTQAGVRHVALRSSTRGMNVLADFKAAWDLWRILRRERFDILHTHNPKPGVYGRVLGRLAGVPIVINTVHGLYATQDHPIHKRAPIYLLEAIAARFSDAELIQSAEDLELMSRLRITRSHRAQLLGNGIDVSRFDPQRFSDVERRVIRQTFGATDNHIVVGMVGRLVAEKGYPELFEAAELLPDRYLIIALGHDDPDKSDALSPAVLERGRQRGIRFLGMREDIERFYRAMDVFILPSHREGVPRAAMEAAAMGLPIVATNIRGCREVVQDGVNGRLVPVRNPRALAHAISALGEDSALRQRLGAAGFQRARERFDERDVVRIVLETYRNVAARKGLTFPAPAPIASAAEEPLGAEAT